MIQIFGKIKMPDSLVTGYGDITGADGTAGGGLVGLLNNVLKLVVVVGGLFALFNIILAGYSFMSAGDDPKKITAAWGKIWQSLLGLLIIAGAFVLAAIFGQLLFRNPMAILSPTVYGPGLP